MVCIKLSSLWAATLRTLTQKVPKQFPTNLQEKTSLRKPKTWYDWNTVWSIVVHYIYQLLASHLRYCVIMTGVTLPFNFNFTVKDYQSITSTASQLNGCFVEEVTLDCGRHWFESKLAKLGSVCTAWLTARRALGVLGAPRGCSGIVPGCTRRNFTYFSQPSVFFIKFFIRSGFSKN